MAHGDPHGHAHEHDHGHDHEHGRAHGHTPPPPKPSEAPEHAPGHAHGRDHGHDHGHGHGHGHATRVPPSRLAIVLGLQFAYMVVEGVGGWWTDSLALLADAGHMATDVTALAMVLVAARIAQRPATRTQTYGWRRAEVLAALANAAALFAVGGGIVVEAFSRFSDPQPIDAVPMMAIAFGGLLVNIAGIFALGTPGHGDLNGRGAWLHLISDALGSVGAVAAGAMMWKFGWMWADPAISLIVSALVLRSAWSMLRDAASVLMESAPPHIDVDGLRTALLAEPGVIGVHDLHVWMIAWGDVSLSGHVVVDSVSCADTPTMLHRLSSCVRERTGISHITLQLEPEGFVEGDVHD